MNILGVPMNTVTFNEAIKCAQLYARGEKTRVILTPNPEMILAAQSNPHLMKALHNADLLTADGIGVVWAGAVARQYLQQKKYRYNKWIIGIRYLIEIVRGTIHSPFPQRVSGSDMMNALCKKAQKKDAIFILGGMKGVAEIAASNLSKDNKQLNVVGTSSASAELKNDKKICKQIMQSGATILFVGFGTPKQEEWIERNRTQLSSVKLIMGIGGAIDFAAQKRKRAPQWMQRYGLEWLFRIIKQPSRIKRIINATIIFPYTFLRSL